MSLSPRLHRAVDLVAMWVEGRVPRPPQALGLEWGTGIYINPVPPELAAERLRGVAV